MPLAVVSSPPKRHSDHGPKSTPRGQDPRGNQPKGFSVFNIRRFLPPFILLAIIAGVAAPAAAQGTTTRILFIRHGEKPEAGLGQLACKGLARSLALPDVILAKFGTPGALFAPNPSHRKPDHGHPYDYIRPLATIEPLAIRAGLPVDVQLGFEQFVKLGRILAAPSLAGSLVVVAWEHKVVRDMVRDILQRHGGDPGLVRKWKDDDFDRIDVVEITRTPGKPDAASYRRDQQGLDGVPGDCPRGAQR